MPESPDKPRRRRPSNRPPGWGGAAKGAGHRFTKGDAVAVEAGQSHAGTSWGEGKRRKIAEKLEDLGARDVVADAWMAILRDPTHPHHATMIDKAATRLDGAPMQPITGEDGGPVQHETKVIVEIVRATATGAGGV